MEKLRTKVGKAGGVLVGGLLLGSVMFGGQPAQAHKSSTVSAPSCSASKILPADNFFTSTETLGITASITGKADLATKRGTAGEGNENYRYAKITIPTIAAGELRIFDGRTTAATNVSAATLCKGSTQIAKYSKSYSSTKHKDGHDTLPGDDAHAVFKIRAQVSPGDEEYIVIVDSDAPASALALKVDFHGAIYRGNVGKNTTRTGLSAEFTQRGQSYGYDFRVTADGLLTVRTTGSTDTKGELKEFTSSTNTTPDPDVTTTTETSLTTAEAGGSGGNFEMVVPVSKNPADTTGTTIVKKIYTVYVTPQTDTTRGKYTLDLDFKVAMATIDWAEFVDPSKKNRMLTLSSDLALTNVANDGYTRLIWSNTPFKDDDQTMQIKKTAGSSEGSDEDYFFFTSDSEEFLSIETETPEKEKTNTTGTLFGPTGQIVRATDGAGGNDFLIDVPIGAKSYVVKVEGNSSSNEGLYSLLFHSDQATNITALPSINGDDTATATCPTDAGAAYKICKATGSGLESDYYTLDIPNAGALYVHTTGSLDTVGVLFGPDGKQITTDDNGGNGNNFRIAANVNKGLHLVQVQGKTRETQGAYGLVVNFVAGTDPVDPITPTDPTPPPTIDPDPTGTLEEPADGSTRSGIGLVRGWVCQDDGNGVQVRIMNADGARVATFTAPYGSARGDVDLSEYCGRRDVPNAPVGFAAQFNYNLLPAGTYTVEAYVGRQQVGLSGGQTNTFQVVRISNAPFLSRLRSGEIEVPDFPRAGDTTILEWDQASQNFQIKRKE